jgi:hypothetical protein
MFRRPSSYRFALLLSLLTALWFSLGGALKVWVAASKGQTIEIIVCSGAGLKKVHVQLQASGDASPEVALKHCGNAPLALMPKEVDTLANLSYSMPQSRAAWHWLEDAGQKHEWFRSGQPPPGRAPPLA